MSFAFKKFSFFQQQEVKAHGFPANPTSYCCGASLIYVGCDNGSVVVLDDGYQLVHSFSAHSHKVLHLAWAQVRGLIKGVAVVRQAGSGP